MSSVATKTVAEIAVFPDRVMLTITAPLPSSTLYLAAAKLTVATAMGTEINRAETIPHVTSLHVSPAHKQIRRAHKTNYHS